MRERFPRADSSRASAARWRTRNLVMPGRLFDDRAAVHRLGGKNLADAALFDDGVVAARQTGSREQILNIAQAAKAGRSAGIRSRPNDKADA